MSNKFFSNDLPAAWAYDANQLSSCGYDDEANTIRNTGFNLDVSAFVSGCITNGAAKLVAMWLPVASVRRPARQVPSTDMPGL